MRSRTGYGIPVGSAARLAVLTAVILSACSLVTGGRNPRVESTMSISLPPVSETTLSNGVRLLAVEYHELPLVTFAAIMPAGSAFDPPGREGLANITASLLTRGTSKWSAVEVAEEIEFLGGSLSAEAGRDFVAVSGEFLVKDIRAGLEIFREVLLEPAFHEDEIERLKREVAAGIVAAREDPGSIAERCFSPLLFSGHPYGHPTSGTEESIGRISREDIVKFYRTYYRPQETVLAIAGDAAGADLLSRLTIALRDWPRGVGTLPELPRPQPVGGRRILLVDKPDATQTQIRLGNIGLSRTDPGYVVAKVMGTVLGGGFSSRLIDELRVKRSLTYGAWSYFRPRVQPGEFTIGTFSKTATAAEALGVTFQVMRDYVSAGPRPEELQRVKNYLIGQYPLALESPSSLIARLVANEAYGLPRSELITYPDKVAATGRAEVMAAARRFVPVDSAAIVVVGPARSLRPVLTPFGSVKTVLPTDCDKLDSVVGDSWS